MKIIYGTTNQGKIDEIKKLFNNHGIDPKVFFAPSHTFDNNTLIAIKEIQGCS